jgi:hypothetical protein
MLIPEVLLLVRLISANPQPQPLSRGVSTVVLASHSFSMNDRYDNSFVNEVFKDNILLTLNFMSDVVKSKAEINWDKVTAPSNYQFSLTPGQGFAFHDKELPQYSQSVVKTTNAHFDSTEGFKSDGNLVGDGVCHLASLMYWTAKDAGLTAIAPKNHNFAKINDVPQEYGVAIYSPTPEENLYIINNLEKTINFNFNYDGQNLTVSVTEEN